MTDKKLLPVREPQALTAGKVIRTAEGARRWGKPIGAVLDGTGGSKSGGSAAPKARAKIGVKIGFKPEQRQAIKVTKRVSTIEPKKSKTSLTKKSLPSKSSSDGSKVKVSLLDRIRDKRLAKAQSKADAKKAQNAPRPGYAESRENARQAHNAEAARKFSDPKNKGRQMFEANAARDRALNEASAKKFKQAKAKDDAIKDAKSGKMTDYEKQDRARRGADKVSKSTADYANKQYGSKHSYADQQRGSKSRPQFASDRKSSSSSRPNAANQQYAKKKTYGDQFKGSKSSGPQFASDPKRKADPSNNKQYGKKPDTYSGKQQGSKSSGPQFASKFGEMQNQAAQRQKSIAKAAGKANAQDQDLINKNKRRLKR